MTKWQKKCPHTIVIESCWIWVTSLSLTISTPNCQTLLILIIFTWSSFSSMLLYMCDTVFLGHHRIYTLRSRQKGCHFADDILMHFNNNRCILLQILLFLPVQLIIIRHWWRWCLTSHSHCLYLETSSLLPLGRDELIRERIYVSSKSFSMKLIISMRTWAAAP